MVERQDAVNNRPTAACGGLGPEFTGVGSGGYAGDLTPPTIYVDGDIDMYVP